MHPPAALCFVQAGVRTQTDGCRVLTQKSPWDGDEAKRAALAEVALKGGFPEEVLRPMREAMEWGLSSILSLHAVELMAPG